MKSIDKKIFAQFQDIFKAMNISERRVQLEIENLKLPPIDFDTRNKLQFDGVELEEDIFEKPPEILTPQIYFKYEERPVIMYLRDQYLPRANYNSGKLRPFHLCFCSALRAAEQKNRYESRYVMTYNTSGNFRVNLWIRDKNSAGKVYTEKKEQDIYRPLKVCQHCLREINWKKFRSYCGGGVEWWRGGNALKRQQIVDEFDIEEYFLTTHENNFFNHPVSGTASLAITKEYSLSPQIKAQLKYFADYTCEICHEVFPADNLQIHHKNHNEGDNRRENLMVVCPACHALIHDAEGGFTSQRKLSQHIVKPTKKSTSDAPKYRIFELANEFNQDSKFLVDFLKKRRIKVSNRFSEVGEDVYQILIKEFKFKTEKISEEDLSVLEYATAQKNLGDMYANGWGVVRDEQKAQIFYQNAMTNYKRLANSGISDAEYELANLYVKFPKEKNLSSEADKLFSDVIVKYRKSHYTKAKIRLGLIYAKGLGVKKNLYEVKEILESIKNNVELADSELIELCQLAGDIEDAQKFHSKAVQLFEIAANNGDTAATFELAKLYSNKDFIGNEFED